MTRRRRILLLGAAGLLSQAVYFAATLRLPWFRYGSGIVGWSQLLGGDRRGFGGCMAAGCGLMALYLVGWLAIRQSVDAARLRRVVWGGALLFAGTLVWLMPVTSDLFTYVTRAHLFTDLGANPLLVAPLEVPPDPLLRAYVTTYSARPAVYGPAWILLSAPGTVGPNDFLTGVVYLKVLATAALIACAFLVERILRTTRPAVALEGLYLFSWNPLVLWMAAGDGHNDIAMMAAALLGLYWLSRERWAAAAGALAASVWIKYVSLVFVPLLLVYGLWAVQAWRRRRAEGGIEAGQRGGTAGPWRPAISALVAGLGVTVVIMAPFWPLAWIAPAIQRLAVPANWYADVSNLPTLALGAGLVLYGLAYVPLLRGVSGDRGSLACLFDRMFVASLLIFVLGAARSQPWHLIWPAALAGLSRKRWAWPTVAVLSAAMLLGQVWVAWGAPGLPVVS